VLTPGILLSLTPAVGITVTAIIRQADDLLPMDLNGLADPYVKAYIMPGAKKVSVCFLRSSGPDAHESDLTQEHAHRDLPSAQ